MAFYPPVPTPLLFSARQISQTITNSTTEAAWSLGGDTVIPAGMLAPGVTFRVLQGGVYQAGLSQNVNPRVRLGPAATALTSRTILATTGPVSGLLNAAADTPWLADTQHTVLSNGSIISIGRLFFSTSATAALAALVATKTAVSGVNFAVDNVLTASAEWGAASASNQITCTSFVVDVMKP